MSQDQPTQSDSPTRQANDIDRLSHIPTPLPPEKEDVENALPSPSTIGPSKDEPGQRGVQFWAAFAAVTLMSMLSSLDGVVLSTALPSITLDLDLGPNYVWAVNVYGLAGAIIQPPLGQICDLWGRRWVTMTTTAIFLLGSGLCGGAHSGTMLIAGRAVQGVGTGGINMMSSLLICDFVPLRDRPKFYGLFFLVNTAVVAVGPLIGGALAGGDQWRWIFFMNLPIGGIAMVLCFIFLRQKHPNTEATLGKKLAVIDWGGVTILAASAVSITYAATYGGVTVPWSHSSVTTSLVAGFLGLVIFALYEGSQFLQAPVIPYRIFSNRTTAVVMLVAFLHSIMALWGVYIMPIYFQAVLGASTLNSGVYMIPWGVSYTLAVMGGGMLVSKLGRYKIIHIGGLGLAAVAAGLLSTLSSESSPAVWVILEILLGFGLGTPQSSLLPAAQAKLEQRDAAISTATLSFLRSFGMIWASTIPQSIFNNRFDQILDLVQDDNAKQGLRGGRAYGEATSEFVKSFPSEIKGQIVEVYTLSLQRSWQIFLGFCLATFLLTFLEQEVVMSKKLETEYGLEERKKKEQS